MELTEAFQSILWLWLQLRVLFQFTKWIGFKLNFSLQLKVVDRAKKLGQQFAIWNVDLNETSKMFQHFLKLSGLKFISVDEASHTRELVYFSVLTITRTARSRMTSSRLTINRMTPRRMIPSSNDTQ